MLEKRRVPSGVEVIGPVGEAGASVLTPDALAFVADLTRKFAGKRDRLLVARSGRQREWDGGKTPDFFAETKEIRESDWKVAPLPDDLLDRRVEITGPAGDRKMVINALNSGAKAFMADFEDSLSPTWRNVIQGQINLRDAVDGTIRFTSVEGKVYELGERPAVLMVRPRGLHLYEPRVIVDGRPVPGSLFDFGLYFFHNARRLIDQGSGPYFYLPKLESHLEARWWNDVFLFAQERLNIPRGTIRATVLIETLPAAFEMEEILYELREHSAGLNCGRWDYIFSCIKRLRNHPDRILPDRSLVTMTVPFMRAYTRLAIRTCHKRGAPCIGGMAAQIPVKEDPEANEAALERVRVDKEREALDGHDGAWVAHPGLVPVVKAVFDRIMPEPNQIHKQVTEAVTAAQLLAVPEGPITEAGLRTNIRVGIQYLEAWLSGRGAVAIDHLMEDAATAEISRAQVWQWIRHPDGVLEDGRPVTAELVKEWIGEEVVKLKAMVGELKYRSGKYEEAKGLFSRLVLEEEFIEFLTVPGSAYLD